MKLKRQLNQRKYVDIYDTQWRGRYELFIKMAYGTHPMICAFENIRFFRAALNPCLIEKLLNSRSTGQFARKINLLNNINIIDDPLQNERVFKLQ